MHTNIYIYIQLHVRVCTYRRKCHKTNPISFVCVNIYTHICISIYKYVDICIIRIYIHTNMYICIYIYTHNNIFTCIHTGEHTTTRTWSHFKPTRTHPPTLCNNGYVGGRWVGGVGGCTLSSRFDEPITGICEFYIFVYMFMHLFMYVNVSIIYQYIYISLYLQKSATCRICDMCIHIWMYVPM